MSITLVSPIDESGRERKSPAARLESLAETTIALLDISKRGGSVFLDALERLLRERYRVGRIVREVKPTFSKPAPSEVIGRLMALKPDAVIEALAD